MFFNSGQVVFKSRARQANSFAPPPRPSEIDPERKILRNKRERSMNKKNSINMSFNFVFLTLYLREAAKKVVFLMAGH